MSNDNSAFANWQSSLASRSEKGSSGLRARPPQNVWGQQTSTAGSRRGVTPLATSNITASSTPSNSSSPLTSFQAGAQQQQALPTGSSIISPRSRTVTPLSQLATTASANSSSQGGPGPGGGGGAVGGLRSGTYSPLSGANLGSPTTAGFERVTSQPGSAGPGTPGSSLSKISVAQVSLLLDTISGKPGQAKWDSKAEQIKKLVESNGTEVYTKYFGRLVSGNASQIFQKDMARSTDLANSTYPILQDEVRGVLIDPSRALKISETIATSEGDIYRDFDLVAFIQHFQLDPIANALLAIAFRICNKADLRNKADSYLQDIFTPFLESLSRVQKSNESLTPTVISFILESIAVSPLRTLGREGLLNILWAIDHRYKSSNLDVPMEVSSSMQLSALPTTHQIFLQRLQKIGPKATASQDEVESLLASIGLDALNEVEVANALLFMVLSHNASQFRPKNFVAAIRSKAKVKRLDWQKVIEAFDIPDLQITQPAFLQLFDLFMLIASDDADIDIQTLWGGKWQNPGTQLSFVLAYSECSDHDIDTSRIPKFRPSYSVDALRDAPPEVKKQAVSELSSHFASADAMNAIFDIALNSELTTREADSQKIIDQLRHNFFNIFLLSAPGFPKPWTPTQVSFVSRCFHAILLDKQRQDRRFLLEVLFAFSPTWVFDECSKIFVHDPLTTELILECAKELNWVEHFLRQWHSPLALDMACVLHRETNFDIENYIRACVEDDPKADRSDIGNTLTKFLKIKAQDDYRTQRHEQDSPRSTSLIVRTVFALLLALEDYISDPEHLTPIQRVCLHTYPRLMNYGEGFDEIIDEAGATSNKLPPQIDTLMSDLFGQMYREEKTIRQVLETMRHLKSSQNPDDQDLFACIIHGLFDEYHCFHEYPLDALQKTALMFGGIINFKLVAGIPLKVGLGLLLDAVRDYQPEDSMWKFGYEALEQLMDRLPEWTLFCSLLVQVPSLDGTLVRDKAEKVLREQGHEVETDGEMNNLRISQTAQKNGGNEDFLSPEDLNHAFRSLRAEPPASGRFEDPDETIQEKIMFVINNLSNDNMSSKGQDLKDALREEHYQWFATLLVDQRARLEPNNQDMYLRLLDMIDDGVLMAEILRETYVSIVKMINAEATMNSAAERSHLKSLGGWLGSLTLARDKPVKHKNVYFIGLLLEGFDTQRLLVVIPFTCKVLLSGAKSTVFKPPNPWLMEIIGLLKELFEFADLKLNLKFEVEVLCGEFGLKVPEVEASTLVRDRQNQLDDETTNISGLPDGIDRFDELSIGGINRGARERLSTDEIMAKLPNLEEVLKYPILPGSPSEQALVKNIIYRAFDLAIQEIIAPVVERSITIASISTAQMLAKDFATEVDVEKYKSAAQKMVKSLAGSLALVTCKEPLRMSITNYIRRPVVGNLPEQYLAEGTILMCVNDNLDTACGFVEEAAAARAIPEIDIVIKPDLEERERHMAERPDTPFVSRILSRWAMYLPEPFKQSAGGLNLDQYAVYDGFDRHAGTNHIQNASMDSTGRQIPDVLQEPLNMPNLSTPAEQPALPHHISGPQDDLQMRMMPTQPRINGFADTVSPQERIQILLSDMQNAAESSSVERTADLDTDSPIVTSYRQILEVLMTSFRPNGEALARYIADKILASFYGKHDSQLVVEVMVILLSKLCQMSELTMRDVQKWLAQQDDSFTEIVPVTLALVSTKLVDKFRIDGIIARNLKARKMPALQLLAELLDYVLFSADPTALRADFAGSLDAMEHWLEEDPNLSLAKEIDAKLQARVMPGHIEASGEDEQLKGKKDHLEYMFAEWVKVCENPSCRDEPRLLIKWIYELHREQMVSNDVGTMAFLRIAVTRSISVFDEEAMRPNGNLNDAYSHIDALAKLIIMLVKYDDEEMGPVKVDKTKKLAAYLHFIILLLNWHHNQPDFNQRVFFRLLSSIFCEYYVSGLQHTDEHRNMILIFADVLLALAPVHFPKFIFAWLTLITHRMLLGSLLKMPDDAGWDKYRRLIKSMLVYATDQFKVDRLSRVTIDLQRGVVTALLAVHHDFPDFLCENHQSFCNAIPYFCTQLRNVILSALPRSNPEWPDPTPGLKVERLEESKKSPVFGIDVGAQLSRLGLKDTVDGAIRKGVADAEVDSTCAHLCDGLSHPRIAETGFLYQPVNVDIEALTTLVLYVGQEALSAGGRFDPTSMHVKLFEKLLRNFQSEGRYCLLNAFADQVRYPNSHTMFFCSLFQHLFTLDNMDPQDTSEIRGQIARLFLERLGVQSPHPWGMLVLFLEMQGNPKYRFWNLLLFDGMPEARQMLQHILRQSL